LIGSDIIFDNYKLTHQIYAETMMELIRNSRVFSAQEILAVAGDERIDADIDQIMVAIESMKVGKYGVKVSKSPNNPTTRMANLGLLLEIAEKYPNEIPPSLIIDSSDVPKKDEIIEGIKERQQQAQQAQAQMAQAQAQMAQAQAAQNQPQRRTLQRR